MAKKSNKAKSGGNRARSSAAPATPVVAPKPIIPTPAILRDPAAMAKLFEAIYDSPNGKRSLSRLARTCRAFAKPALDILWRDLDSIVPIVGLFPNHLMKKAHKPGLGLSGRPVEEDWKAITQYSSRVRRITYDESSNAITPTVFPILEECRPEDIIFILPQLQELTWKVDSAAGLENCKMFLNPGLQVLNLEVGTRIPQLTTFLSELGDRVNLKGFSFISPTNLPDSFTELLRRHHGLEKVVLVAPGALAPGVGRWLAGLRHLKQLQLDLTNRSHIAVEGFFEDMEPRSGDSTPSSISSRDSGIFSGEELDFTEIRKSAMRLTGDLPSNGSFARLRKLQLTGEVANVAVFLKHLNSHLGHLDLVVDDPSDPADWQDLSALICERFSETLQSLRISASAAARYADLMRQTSRTDAPSGHLPLDHISYLPLLNRLEIDLPDSVMFTPEDIECLARACPRLEVLRLCPTARFPVPYAPKLSLESLGPLVEHCRRLHTLAAVVNATPMSQSALMNPYTSSPSILRFHVGHSWANDPLQISISLSHLMPRLESLKWFQEKTRAGFNEAHAKVWQSVSETLPHLQLIRHIEKSFYQPVAAPLPEKETTEKSIDATVTFRTQGVSASVQTSDMGTQSSPSMVNQEVEAIPELCSISVDATVSTCEMAIETEEIIETMEIDDTQQEVPPSPIHHTSPIVRSIQNIYVISSIFNFLSFACRLALFPVSLGPSGLRTALLRLPLTGPGKRGRAGSVPPTPSVLTALKKTSASTSTSPLSSPVNAESSTVDSIPLSSI